jgi:hypothetical protein
MPAARGDRMEGPRERDSRRASGVGAGEGEIAADTAREGGFVLADRCASPTMVGQRRERLIFWSSLSVPPSEMRQVRMSCPGCLHARSHLTISEASGASKMAVSPKTCRTVSTELPRTPTQSNESAYETTPYLPVRGGASCVAESHTYRLTRPYDGFNPTTPV